MSSNPYGASGGLGGGAGLWERHFDPFDAGRDFAIGALFQGPSPRAVGRRGRPAAFARRQDGITANVTGPPGQDGAISGDDHGAGAKDTTAAVMAAAAASSSSRSSSSRSTTGSAVVVPTTNPPQRNRFMLGS
jgi:hypothetical protein